jgi:CDP-diacylglycerol--glycerol-3-phosphate 3-phosphatidyltransferase
MKSWDDYAVGWRDLHGGFDPRGASPLVRGWLRLAYETGRRAAILGATPTTVTVAGLLLSLAVPVSVLAGPVGVGFGALLVLLSAVADSVDGAVAVIADRASRLGHVYDSLADRVSEAGWLVALWLVGAPPWLAVLAGALSWLHEYLRARAAVSGLVGVGVVTVAERPTRIIVTVAGLLLGSLTAVAATVATAGWVVLAAVGFGQLFLKVHRALR